jgi:hypothetical protein
MRNSKRVQTSQFAEDVTHQAGWMYADLFLALMVIFLATISFVPKLTAGPATGNAKQTQTVSLKSVNFDQGMANLYNGFDLPKLRADIADFKKKSKLSDSAQIIYVQVIGGYAKTEKASVGTLAAINFSVELKKQAADLFDGAAIKLDTSNAIPSGSVALRMTFAAKSY